MEDPSRRNQRAQHRSSRDSRRLVDGQRLGLHGKRKRDAETDAPSKHQRNAVESTISTPGPGAHAPVSGVSTSTTSIKRVDDGRNAQQASQAQAPRLAPTDSLPRTRTDRTAPPAACAPVSGVSISTGGDLDAEDSTNGKEGISAFEMWEAENTAYFETLYGEEDKTEQLPFEDPPLLDAIEQFLPPEYLDFRDQARVATFCQAFAWKIYDIQQDSKHCQCLPEFHMVLYSPYLKYVVEYYEGLCELDCYLSYRNAAISKRKMSRLQKQALMDESILIAAKRDCEGLRPWVDAASVFADVEKSELEAAKKRVESAERLVPFLEQWQEA